MKLESKICSEAEIQSRLDKLARPLVMTNGVFDVMHRGHVNYLQRAAELGGALLVAVNTDRSVRMLGKGPDRPLNSEYNRAYVLAGLASVDIVTFFDAKTPVELIKYIKPDVYVKGGDYEMEELEETRIVRSWGGYSVAMPFIDGFSTSALVERIRAPKRKAVFLDRDGVINKDNAYVGRWEDFEFLPGSVEGIRLLQAVGYVIVIVTNQSGIARGYYDDAQYQTLTKQMLATLREHGVEVSGVYYCPHHPEGVVPNLAITCSCRKPAPGLIVQAALELNLSLQDSVMIGDKLSDIQAANSAGVSNAYLVKSDSNEDDKAELVKSVRQFKTLLECAEYITARIKEQI